MPNFIETYLEFNSGNECPRNYHIWTALAVLAATAHKKVSVDWGYFEIFPNLFICLVGKQGLRKSTAKDIGANLFKETFPDYPIGASVQSREDIIRFMSTPECVLPYVNPDGTTVDVRPYVVFINELKNFLSVDPGKMVEFLTDIYDSRHFKSGTIKRGLEDIVNPCVNLLACETPEWITDKLKGKIISGGWSRRMIYVYELKKGATIPIPQRPEGHAVMYKNLQEHLLRASKIVGRFRWTDEALQWWDTWYRGLKFPDDEVMAGYYESKHIQLLKIVMLLVLAEFDVTADKLVIEVPYLIRGAAMLDILEENMPKLSQAAGRNELAVPMQKAMELVEASGGWIPEKTFKKLLGKDLSPMELIQVMRFLTQETDQLVVKKVSDLQKVERVMVMTKEKERCLKDAMLKDKGLPPSGGASQ